MKKILLVLGLAGVLLIYGCGTVARETGSGGGGSGKGGSPSTPPTYTLTITVSPNSSGTVPTSPNRTTFSSDEIVDLTAVANSGYVFDHWESDLTGSANVTSITMTTNKKITAVFRLPDLVQYPLAISIVGSGTISKSPNQSLYNDGSTVQLQADPDSGWVFDSWSGDMTGSTNPANLDINSAKNVTATFKELPPDVDMTPPQDVTATVSGILTYLRTSVPLMGNSSTPLVSYSWEGPGGFISWSKNPIVGYPGTYLLTVTNPANGTISTASVTVVEDKSLPENVTASVSGILNCYNSSVTLTASSSSDGVTYQWTGPGLYPTTERIIQVSIFGTYALTVTKPNGGSVMVQVRVEKDYTIPADVTATVNGKLTGGNLSVTLTGYSSTDGVEYHWAGPQGFTSDQRVTNVSVPGTYVLTVTYPVSGATVQKQVTVEQNITPPANVTAWASGILTYLRTTVMLQGYSTTPLVSYRWDGPDGFTSNMQNTMTSAGGTFILTVTNPASGLTSTASVTVIEDKSLPENVTATVNGTLNDINLFVELRGDSSTDGVSYYWSGPEGFETDEQNFVTPIPGTYVLTVTKDSNGGKVIVSVEVIQE